MSDPRTELADVLRGRILRALHGSALKSGDRLPSARELGQEFGTDHRVVLDAYRMLAQEGLVEVRERGGIYVAARTAGRAPLPSDHWLSEVFAQGVMREIPLTDLHEWFHRAVSTLRLRAVVVQESADQVAGLCRELSDDYGVEATGIVAAALADGADTRPEFRYADLLVTTAGLEAQVRAVAARVGKPVLVISMRPDLIPGEWRLLLRRPVYVVVADERFIEVLNTFFASTPGVENLRPLVAGRDDLSVIPDGAPVYITANARGMLHGAQIRGNILPSVRMFSTASSLELIRFIVSANLDALGNRTLQPPLKV